MRSILSQRISTPPPGSRLRFFIAMQIQYLLAHLSTAVQNPGFEFVREESVKVYLHMHNGNVQQNPLCVESCVANGFSISFRLSPTMFDPDANLVLLRAHLCTAVDFMCRKACVRNCSRERKGLYNGNVLLTHLYTAAVLIGSMRRTLCSKLFMLRA